MRFEICLDCEKEIRLPMYYNSSVQDMIYDNINTELYGQFCNEEYIHEKKKFELFTFSRLKGRSRIDLYNQQIIFKPPVEIILSSPIEYFLNELGYLMLICDDVYIGENHLKMSKLRIMEQPDISSLELIYMLSPVIVYDTFIEDSGKLSNRYYSPDDYEFSKTIENDLRKKFFMIYNYELEESQGINIIPVKVEEKVFRFGTESEISSWIGTFILEGDPKLINIGYEAGIGYMNSSGFGCFEFINGKRRLPYYMHKYPI